MYLDKLIKAITGGCSENLTIETKLVYSCKKKYMRKTAGEMINSNNYLRLLTLLNDGFIGLD